jgi:hypothetical protein
MKTRFFSARLHGAMTARLPRPLKIHTRNHDPVLRNQYSGEISGLYSTVSGQDDPRCPIVGCENLYATTEVFFGTISTPETGTCQQFSLLDLIRHLACSFVPFAMLISSLAGGMGAIRNTFSTTSMSSDRFMNTEGGYSKHGLILALTKYLTTSFPL